MEFAPANDRGFYVGKFNDRYHNECSLQESSIMAEEGHVWFGMHSPELKYMAVGGWRDLTEAQISTMLGGAEFHAFSRMHLSQTDISNLIPSLMYFTKHGYLPDENHDETKQEMDGYRESVRSLRESV